MAKEPLRPEGLQILVVGSGGREHALAERLSFSPRVAQVHCAPGNAGTQGCALNVPIDVLDFPALVAYARHHAIDLVVVGPSEPLTEGLVDALAEAGIPAFGPSRAAAVLEGSKAFSKAFMRRHGIPTAECAVFDDAERAHAHLEARWSPHGIVIKVDGLAAVQSTLVTTDKAEAHAEIDRALVARAYGAAGARVLIEERLVGPEVSLLAFFDGQNYRTLQPAQDHKTLHENGAGPNTEGMGAYAPAPLVTPELARRLEREVLEPTCRGLAAEGLGFAGLLFVGLMLTPDGPKVLEYNCRFGDPEAQVTLPGLENDLVDVLEACLLGRLDALALRFDAAHHLCVVGASGGYPEAPRIGGLLSGLEAARRVPNARVYLARTLPSPEGPRAHGGRVLNAVGSGPTLEAARSAAYAAIAPVRIEGEPPHYRSDIGAQALAREARVPSAPARTLAIW